jgi:hypothetical protein
MAPRDPHCARDWIICGIPIVGPWFAWKHMNKVPNSAPMMAASTDQPTAGVYFPSDPAEFRAYAQRLDAFGVAGLGIGISPIHQTVPPALVAACAELALPLLEVPPSIPFIAISEAVVSELEAQRQTDLGRLNQAQRSLVKAATRPRAMPAIVRQRVRAASRASVRRTTWLPLAGCGVRGTGHRAVEGIP